MRLWKERVATVNLYGVWITGSEGGNYDVRVLIYAQFVYTIFPRVGLS